MKPRRHIIDSRLVCGVLGRHVQHAVARVWIFFEMFIPACRCLSTIPVRIIPRSRTVCEHLNHRVVLSLLSAMVYTILDALAFALPPAHHQCTVRQAEGSPVSWSRSELVDKVQLLV